LLSPKVGKYMFIGAVVLLVLLGGFYGATQFGLMGSSGDDATISGTVYVDGEPAEGVTVVLSGDQLNESLDDTTASGGLFGILGSPGQYKFSDVQNGTYNLTATVDGEEYEETEVEPGETVDFGEATESDEPGGLFSFLPIIGGSDSGANETEPDSEPGGDTAPGNESGAEEGSGADADSQAPSDGNSTDDSGSESTIQTFSLRGTVTDASGLEADGVNVIIENESLLADQPDGEIKTESGEGGKYETKPALPNGTYTLKGSVPVSESNSDQSYSEIIKIAGNTTKDIQLESGA